MTLQVRAVGTINHGTSPRNIPTTGITSGDLVLLHIGLANDLVPTVPAGFVLVPGSQITGTNNIRVYAKVAGGSEPANYTVSWVGGGAGAVEWGAFYSDSADTIIFDDIDQLTNPSGDRVYPSVNASGVGALLLCFGVISNTTTQTPPGGMTERWDGGGPALYMMSATLGSAGASGTRTINSGTPGSSKTVSMTLIEESAINPTVLTATPISPTQIDLDWQDNWGGETGYKIERSPAGAGTWVEIDDIAADSESYSDTTVVEYTNYDYRVKAYSDASESDYSNTATGRSFLATPTGLAVAVISHNELQITWNDNSSAEEGYKLERSPNGTTGWVEIADLADDVETYDDEGLTDASTYHYRVRAYQGSDHSAYSNVDSDTTEVAPTGTPLASALSSKRIVISWANGSELATGTKVERSADGVSGWSEVGSVPLATTSFVDSDLAANTEYFYRTRHYKD